MEYASAESIFIILRHVISVCNSVAHARSCQRTGIGGVAWRRVTELNLGRHEASCCTALVCRVKQKYLCVPAVSVFVTFVIFVRVVTVCQSLLALTSQMVLCRT